MANNRLYLRCVLDQELIAIARLSAGDDDWTPSRTPQSDLATFLAVHSQCAADGSLHVELASENDDSIDLGGMATSAR